MKTLLTNPPRSPDFGHCLVQPDWPHLSLPYLAALFGGEVRIVDNSHSYRARTLEREVNEFNPDVIQIQLSENLKEEDLRSFLTII